MLEKSLYKHLTRLKRVSARIFRVVARFDTCQSFCVTSWHRSTVSCHPLTRFKKLTDTNLTGNKTNCFETFQPDTCHSLVSQSHMPFFCKRNSYNFFQGLEEAVVAIVMSISLSNQIVKSLQFQFCVQTFFITSLLRFHYRHGFFRNSDDEKFSQFLIAYPVLT